MSCFRCLAILSAAGLLALAGGLVACNDRQKTASPHTPRSPAPFVAPSVPTNPLDLRTMSGRATYTLQIGYYDQLFGPDFRQAAEKAAQTLRQDGHLAFFYHGPNRSLVTVGLFGPDAVSIDPRTGLTTYSPAVQALRKQFKYHLGNGRELLVKRPDGTKTPQFTQLVRIPRPPLR